jgi:malonyl-CoA decarboxylase
MKQSYGLMVNYLYDLKRMDKHRALLAQGKVPIVGAIEALYLWSDEFSVRLAGTLPFHF